MEAAGAGRAVVRAAGDPALAAFLADRPLHVVAAGKAAAAMAAALVGLPGLVIRRALAVGTEAAPSLPSNVQWMTAGHPFPDERSVRAGERALDVARAVPAGEQLALLVSGGASSLVAAPRAGVTLADKVHTARVMMRAGADIVALNTVRRHLSRVKGGRLAAACAGRTLTLAVSDVVGDDLRLIGSGPGVPAPAAWDEVAGALERWGGLPAHAPSVVALVARERAGDTGSEPSPDGSGARRASGRVIAGRADAMAGAAASAAARGYHPIVLNEPVTGEARVAAPRWWADVRTRLAHGPRPACVISSGETTVRVSGRGVGGRNLEFALALAAPLSGAGVLRCASVGTDGVDGPSGVAGGRVDDTTLQRAEALGLAPPAAYLEANDSLSFFAALGDVVRLGHTDTNVGDLQVLVAG